MDVTVNKGNAVGVKAPVVSISVYIRYIMLLKVVLLYSVIVLIVGG